MSYIKPTKVSLLEKNSKGGNELINRWLREGRAIGIQNSSLALPKMLENQLYAITGRRKLHYLGWRDFKGFCWFLPGIIWKLWQPPQARQLRIWYDWKGNRGKMDKQEVKGATFEVDYWALAPWARWVSPVTFFKTFRKGARYNVMATIVK